MNPSWSSAQLQRSPARAKLGRSLVCSRRRGLVRLAADLKVLWQEGVARVLLHALLEGDGGLLPLDAVREVDDHAVAVRDVLDLAGIRGNVHLRQLRRDGRVALRNTDGTVSIPVIDQSQDSAHTALFVPLFRACHPCASPPSRPSEMHAGQQRAIVGSTYLNYALAVVQDVEVDMGKQVVLVLRAVSGCRIFSTFPMKPHMGRSS